MPEPVVALCFNEATRYVSFSPRATVKPAILRLQLLITQEGLHLMFTLRSERSGNRLAGLHKSALLILVVSLPACASTPSVTPLDVVMQCKAYAKLSQKIRVISAASFATVELPLGYHRAMYLDCLRSKGLAIEGGDLVIMRKSLA
jgi:hypothetical protein